MSRASQLRERGRKEIPGYAAVTVIRAISRRWYQNPEQRPKKSAIMNLLALAHMN